MTKKFTADPTKASVVTPSRRVPLEDGERMIRTAALEGVLDDADLTVQAIVATGAPVARRDAKGPFLEVLDPAGLRMDQGADYPLLEDHKIGSRTVCGRVHSLIVEGDAVHASLRLTQADDAAPLRQRIKDGSLKHVSAGYSVSRWEESRDAEGRRVKTATRWRLLEVSLTPIPADNRAKIQRSADMAYDLETRSALVETLRSACALPETWGAELAEENVTDQEVREAAREAMLARTAPKIRVTQQHDDPAQIQTRAADALAYRMSGGELPEASRGYVGLTLRDHAAESLQRAGVSTRGLTGDELFQRAALGTSDFPLLVSNAMGKVALDSYKAAESPLKALARQRTLANFKPSTSIRLGEMGRLEEMTEHGEFKHTSRAENGEAMSLKTFGRAIKVSRQLLIDDDLNALGDITSAMGTAAAQTEADEMVALLSGNPALSDGKGVFHADRGNLATDALSETSLAAARQVMRTTKGLDGATIIDALPKHLVVGPELELEAEKLLSQIYAASTNDVNVFAGRLQLVVEPRLTGTGWFLMADAGRRPVPAIRLPVVGAGRPNPASRKLGFAGPSLSRVPRFWLRLARLARRIPLFGRKLMSLTVADLQEARDRLLQARFGGIREVRDQSGETVSYKSDGEMARALAALETMIRQAATSRPSGVTYLRTSKGI